MTKFLARIKEGGLNFGSDYNAARFRDFAKQNIGKRVEIRLLTPESRNQRGYFEGAVVSLATYYQEGLDHRKPEDLRKVREWLKAEFLGEAVVIDGKAHRIGGSTKGKLADGFVEKVIDWLNDNYAPPVEALDPESYKKFRDEIYPVSDFDSYIDYLVFIGKIKEKGI